MSKKILIVGSGMSGAVIARELAQNGYQVHIIDKRNHIGGNCYDFVNEANIRQHAYGPHIFHTNNAKVVEWLSKFTKWIPYQHKVKALLEDGQYVTLPVNRETKAIVGEENVIDTFIRPYTKKMWGMEIEELDPSILNRVPIRDDDNELYFPNDEYQFMPADGYTSMVLKILTHENITGELGIEFNKSMEKDYDFIFNSMPIDEYFDFQFGELPYRSIKFHSVTLPVSKLLPVPCVNFTHDGPNTRITEWKNFPNHGTSKTQSTFTYEEPCDYKDNNMERYYPVKDISGKNRENYKKYRDLIPDNMEFIGRCGLYVYLDMDMAINSSLQIAKRFLNDNNSKKT